MGLATAWASGGPGPGSGGGDSLTTILFLLAVVGGAYLATHFVVGRLQQTFLFLSGFEYIALGVALGPTELSLVHAFDDMTAMGPVFAFAAGWVGLLYGLGFELKSLEIVGRPMRIALMDVLVTGGLVTAAAHAFFRSGLAMAVVADEQAWLSAMVLGCTAAAGSTSAANLLEQRYQGAETHLLPMLQRVAQLENLLSITLFGLLFCVFHVGSTLTSSPPSASDWILLTVAGGIGLGVLFSIFIGNDKSGNNVFLAMVGILLFASGAAFFLNLSALLVNLLLGMFLAQTRQGVKIADQLERTGRPVSLTLLLFAGALWQPVPWIPALVLILGLVGLRLLGKVIAVFLATVGTPLRTDLFRGMAAQGNVSVAMALSFQIVYDGPEVDLAYTAILIAVVVHELSSPRLLRGLLVDAGELRQDLPWIRS
ncbi:MAG TPA: hypothetical protein ENK18_12405 [Deltaproteobacteria bacterium]|nr:hypothetical protein [Deltaproteobacteria bacterium]